VIDRWKILDNLRRSLTAPALLALIVAGWLWLPGAPALWTAAAALTLAVPLLTSSISGLIQGLRRRRWQGIARPLLDALLRWLLALAFLPHEALVMLTTILITLVRLFVTHRHLLQWTTAAHTARRYGDRMGRYGTWRAMLDAVLLAAGIAA
jgi:cyclic beta-1,2-glucan synthetase